MVPPATVKSEDRVDVLVVGAGPAGSAAAMTLAKAGYDVLMVDRCVFPRDKVCGDALIPDAVQALERLGLKQRVLRHSRALDGVRVYAPGGEFIDVTADTALAAGDQAYLCGNAEMLKAAAAAC